MKKIIIFILILSTIICSDFSYASAFDFSNLKPIKLNYRFYDLDDFISSYELKNSYILYTSYLNKLNILLKDCEEFKRASLEDLLKNLDSIPDEISKDVRINASNALNFEYFFRCISPEKTFPRRKLLKAIEKSFSSFNNFKSEFKKAALGSKCNWIFLAKNSNGSLYIATSKDLISPVIFKHQIVLCLNLDENLYSDKSKIVNKFLNYVNWDQAQINYNLK